MNPDTEKLYSPEELAGLTEEQLAKIKWVSREEYRALQGIEYGKRTKALRKMRDQEKKDLRKKRKAQRQARKRNR